jgi:hypothetical protein
MESKQSSLQFVVVKEKKKKGKAETGLRSLRFRVGQPHADAVLQSGN